MALLLILALAAAAVYLIFFRSDSSQTKRITQKTSITLETIKVQPPNYVMD